MRSASPEEASKVPHGRFTNRKCRLLRVPSSRRPRGLSGLERVNDVHSRSRNADGAGGRTGDSGHVAGSQASIPYALSLAGLMCANMLRAFQVGKAFTSDGGPSSWIRPPPVA